MELPSRLSHSTPRGPRPRSLYILLYEESACSPEQKVYLPFFPTHFTLVSPATLPSKGPGLKMLVRLVHQPYAPPFTFSPTLQSPLLSPCPVPPAVHLRVHGTHTGISSRGFPSRPLSTRRIKSHSRIWSYSPPPRRGHGAAPLVLTAESTPIGAARAED